VVATLAAAGPTHLLVELASRRARAQAMAVRARVTPLAAPAVARALANEESPWGGWGPLLHAELVVATEQAPFARVVVVPTQA